MKTYRISILISIFLSLILMMNAENTFGQGRSIRGKDGSSRNSSSSRSTKIASSSDRDRVSTSNGRNSRSSYGYSRDGRSSSQTSSNTYDYTPRNSQTQVHKNNNQLYSYSGTEHQYNKPDGHHTYVNTYAYYPKTYYTWHYPAPWKYATHSIVFQHHHGNYFYYHGSFFRYRQGRGYYRVGIPTGVVFEYLPVGYEKVFIGGHLFYRYGEVYFEYSPGGYRIIPRPVGIVISAHF